MSLIKRTFISLQAKVDNLVGDIENHDALIKVAIGEQKQKIAAAKIETKRLESQLFKVEQDLHDAKTNINRWTERAVREAAEDESKALACLKRKQATAKKLSELNRIRSEYQSTLTKMKSNIGRCESEFQGMMQKHQLLRARQSTSEAMQYIDQYHANSSDALATSFDRWETRLAQTDFQVDMHEDIDAVEQTYIDEEQTSALKDELATLLASHPTQVEEK